MSDSATDFFHALGKRGHEPLWGKVTGTVRFDLTDGGRTETWLVSIDKGDVTAERGNGPADCTIGADRALFDEICRGRENTMAAVLRGAISCAGDVEMLFAVQRVFPGPPRRKAGATTSRSAR